VIVVWSDYVSPYAFVAKAGAYALEADYEVELQWRPYTMAATFRISPPLVLRVACQLLHLLRLGRLVKLRVSPWK
jgi:2-hydroxychromene-2-carboxylate isomerase